MRRTNYLIVSGEASEIDELVGRIEADNRVDGWRRSLDNGQSPAASGAGRLGRYLYHWSGGEGRPAADLLISRTLPGQLSIFNILPDEWKPLTTEEFNQILADFDENVLRPLTAGLDIKTTIFAPRKDRLAQSLSPEAFRRLNRFILMIDDPANLTIDDRARWGEFWFQFYSDGSMIENGDLGDWLREEGFSEHQVSDLIARKDVGRPFAHHDRGL